MNNTPDASIAWTDPTITRLAERYYQRLAEVLGQRFPQIRSPVAPPSPSLEDFYSAVDALLRQNETPALGIEQGYGIRISDYGVIGLAIASAASLGEALQVQGDYLALITDTKRFRYRLIEASGVLLVFDCRADGRLIELKNCFSRVGCNDLELDDVQVITPGAIC